MSSLDMMVDDTINAQGSFYTSFVLVVCQMSSLNFSLEK